jgi:hypothetical protein
MLASKDPAEAESFRINMEHARQLELEDEQAALVSDTPEPRDSSPRTQGRDGKTAEAKPSEEISREEYDEYIRNQRF